jgi:hypothetical protein
MTSASWLVSIFCLRGQRFWRAITTIFLQLGILPNPQKIVAPSRCFVARTTSYRIGNGNIVDRLGKGMPDLDAPIRQLLYRNQSISKRGHRGRITPFYVLLTFLVASSQGRQTIILVIIAWFLTSEHRAVKYRWVGFRSMFPIRNSHPLDLRQ